MGPKESKGGGKNGLEWNIFSQEGIIAHVIALGLEHGDHLATVVGIGLVVAVHDTQEVLNSLLIPLHVSWSHGGQYW